MKDLRFSALLSLYGKMLTEKQLRIMTQYHDLDCSLFEISESEGVSRQAVHASLRQAQNALTELEGKIGLYIKSQVVKNTVNGARGSRDVTVLQAALDKIEELW